MNIEMNLLSMLLKGGSLRSLCLPREDWGMLGHCCSILRTFQTTTELWLHMLLISLQLHSPGIIL